MTGTGTPLAIVPKEEQAGVDMIPHGDNLADGRDLGAAENMIDTARAGKAQVARNDHHKGYGKGHQRQLHPKDQTRDCGAGPRHQQQPQDQQGQGKTQTAAQLKQERSRLCRAPRAAPEQQGASADPGNEAGTEEREGPVLSDPGQRAPKMEDI
jgi:hypothetical protein